MIRKTGYATDAATGIPDSSDADLVRQSLSGNREAFGRIVVRYQTLICSLTYSGTGSLGQSEDLAQETFLTAFQQLANLREPQKLRSWLCGIARNLMHNTLKQQGREPTHAAQPLDTLDTLDALGVNEPSAPEPQPREAAISREEQTILWQAVERVPEIYREPLVLFYREHKSVEIVARDLDLTEDAVKQRLARGRKLLQEQVMAFVEGALEQTSPSTTFTLGVVAALASLPAMSVPAKAAATLGAAGATSVAGKSVAAAKGAALGSAIVAVFAMLLAPLLSVLASFFITKRLLKVVRAPRENVLVKRHSRFFFLFYVPLPFCISFLGIKCLGLDKSGHFMAAQSWLYMPLAVLVPIGWFAFSFAGMGRDARNTETSPPVLEYRSRARFLGLPLIHVCYPRQCDSGEETKPAAGWIAIGETAYGILFACGRRLAVGGISWGAISFGIVSAGTVSFGFLTAGVLAVGAFANGFAGIGWATSAAIFVSMYSSWVSYGVGYGGNVIPPYLERYAAPFLVHAHNWQAHIFWILVISVAMPFLLFYLSKLTEAWLLRKARNSE